MLYSVMLLELLQRIEVVLHVRVGSFNSGLSGDILLLRVPALNSGRIVLFWPQHRVRIRSRCQLMGLVKGHYSGIKLVIQMLQ